MADVAQLVRALVCGTRCREFESHLPPHFEIKPLKIGAFLLPKMLVFRWDTGVGHKGGTQSNQNRVKICHHFQADLRRLDKTLTGCILKKILPLIFLSHQHFYHFSLQTILNKIWFQMTFDSITKVDILT